MMQETAQLHLDTAQSAADAVTRCVLFSDVVDSTHTIDERGDEVWLQLLERHARLVWAIAEHHGGQVVNFLGDGFMVMFEDAGEAVACALRMQYASDVQGLVGTRIGLDHGTVHPYREGWWVGRAIHVASRLTEIGGHGEVVLSHCCFEAASDRVALLDREQRVVQLRGLCEPSVIHVLRPGGLHE